MKKFLSIFTAMALFSCSNSENISNDEVVSNVNNQVISKRDISGPSSTTNNFDRITFNGFYINNNAWNTRSSGTDQNQKVWGNDINNWGFTANHKYGPGNQQYEVKAYPSIVFGRHYSTGSTNSLPKRISDLGDVTTSWTFSNTYDSGNTSYDIWFDNDVNIANRAAKYELMIWLDYKVQNPIQDNARYDANGVGIPLSTETIGKVKYKIYKGNNGAGSTVFSFLRVSKTNSVKGLKIKPFIDYINAKKWMGENTSNIQMTSVQAGWEVLQGGSAATTKFSLTGL
jgi:hypothetical protein